MVIGTDILVGTNKVLFHTGMQSANLNPDQLQQHFVQIDRQEVKSNHISCAKGFSYHCTPLEMMTSNSRDLSSTTQFPSPYTCIMHIYR